MLDFWRVFLDGRGDSVAHGQAVDITCPTCAEQFHRHSVALDLHKRDVSLILLQIRADGL